MYFDIISYFSLPQVELTVAQTTFKRIHTSILLSTCLLLKHNTGLERCAIFFYILHTVLSTCFGSAWLSPLSSWAPPSTSSTPTHNHASNLPSNPRRRPCPSATTSSRGRDPTPGPTSSSSSCSPEQRGIIYKLGQLLHCHQVPALTSLPHKPASQTTTYQAATNQTNPHSSFNHHNVNISKLCNFTLSDKLCYFRLLPCL